MKKFLKIFGIIAGSLLLIWGVFHFLSSKRNQNQIYGASFNSKYAQYLGLDSQKVFSAMLDDWGFKYVRLSAQWNEIEKNSGIYDFSALNALMDQAASRGVKVTLVVGQKIPRWPECHVPAWAANLSDNEYKAAIKRFVKTVVDQYKDHSALEIWQVENEPLLAYGECRFFGKDMLADEINLVRSIDAEHKILITDSGELSSWRNTAKAGDLFGTTMYRVVWHARFGYFSYDWLTPLFYKMKLWLTGQAPDKAYIAELQAEPWVPDRDIKELTASEMYESLDLKRFQKNVDYAKRVGFSRAYLWGAEWWYWMKEVRGVAEFADYAKTLKKE